MARASDPTPKGVPPIDTRFRRIVTAIPAPGSVEQGLLHSYGFPNAARAALVESLVGIAPAPLAKAFLLTAGSEATECAIKLACTCGQKHGDPAKIAVVSFERAFHGRGQVAGLHLVHPGGKVPDGNLAFSVVEKAFQKGLLLFAPVGFGGATVKVAPPLKITSDAVREGLAVLKEAIAEAMASPVPS